MKKILLTILSAIAIVTHAAAPDEFTPQERATLANLRQKMIASCKAQVNDMLESKLKGEKKLAQVPSIAAWITGLVGGIEYCTCSMNKSFEKMTPQLLRYGTEAEGEVVGRRAGAECVLPKLQATFPGFCKGMLKETIESEGLSARPEAISDICGCVQKDIDAITPDTIELVMKSTAVDSKAMEANRGAQLNQNSLIASMARCGIGDLGRK
jgi:hypothetical protein